VKQDNVTVKEIVKPMKIDAQMEQLTKALYDKTHKNDTFDDDEGHKIIESIDKTYLPRYSLQVMENS